MRRLRLPENSFRRKRWINSDWYATLAVTSLLEGLTEEELKSQVEGLGLCVLSMKRGYDLEQNRKTFTFELKCSREQRFKVPQQLAVNLAQAPGVKQIEWS